MKQSPFIFLLLSIVAVNSFSTAQTKNYLPDNAINIRSTPSEQSMFTIADEFGNVPYKGHNCWDEGSSFEETPDGKKLSENEWITVHVNMQHYSAEGKFMFDNIMKMTPPANDLINAEKIMKAESNPDFKRTTSIKDIEGGKILYVTDLYTNCTDGKYTSWTHTTWQSYAVIGQTIVKSEGAYNSGDVSVAEKIHLGINSKVRQAFK